MTEEIYNYTVRCRTCRCKFEVQLFDTHEKNLFLVDKKTWFCEKCKKEYFDKRTTQLTNEHKNVGFQEITGTSKMVSWAVKIRADMLNKVRYLQESLTFDSHEAKEKSERAFEMFLSEWQAQTEAKWWIDHRNMNVRDISKRIGEISQAISKE
ncbi:MAG: hypothetical protein ABIK15_13810 [Pseudomonadota bacterium]